MHGLEEKEVGYIAGTPYVGVEVRMKAGPGDGHRGEFTAWDIKAGKNVWSINEKFPVWSGVLATAGDVVFYGTMDGWFKAVDAKTGWQFKTSSGIIGQPTTSHYTRANECRKIEALPKFANASYVRSLPSGVSVPSLVRSAFRAVRVVGASAVNVRQWLAGGVLDDDRFLTLFDRVRRGNFELIDNAMPLSYIFKLGKSEWLFEEEGGSNSSPQDNANGMCLSLNANLERPSSIATPATTVLGRW